MPNEPDQPTSLRSAAVLQRSANMKTYTLLILLCFIWLTSLPAQLVNVKFGDNVYTGVGVVGSGNYWNYFSGNSGNTLAGLKDQSGVSTPLSLQVTYGSRFGGSSTSGNTPVKLLGSGLYGPFAFTISGLDPLKKYMIYTYHCDKAGRVTTTQVTGISSAIKTPTSTITSTAFIGGGNFLIFGDVTASTNGTILGSSSVAWGGLNAIQIMEIQDNFVISSYELITNSSFTLIWIGQPGFGYQAQYSSTLQSNDWHNLRGEQTAANGQVALSFVDTSPTSEFKRFYRVHRQLIP